MMKPFFLFLVAVPLILSGCALSVTEEAADVFNQTLTELSDAADERELARRYEVMPGLRAACMDASGFVGERVSVGENLCSVVVEAPSGTRDASRVRYRVRTHYLLPVGSFLAPAWDSRYEETTGQAPMNAQQPKTFTFPWYFASQNWWGGVTQLAKSTFDVVWANRGPLMTYLQLPSETIYLTGTSPTRLDVASLGTVAVDLFGVLEGLVSREVRPYALEISASVCGSQYCTPERTVLLEVGR